MSACAMMPRTERSWSTQFVAENDRRLAAFAGLAYEKVKQDVLRRKLLRAQDDDRWLYKVEWVPQQALGAARFAGGDLAAG